MREAPALKILMERRASLLRRRLRSCGCVARPRRFRQGTAASSGTRCEVVEEVLIVNHCEHNTPRLGALRSSLHGACVRALCSSLHTAHARVRAAELVFDAELAGRTARASRRPRCPD